MISPHTPPGTGLIVVWTSSEPEDLLAILKPEYREVGRIVIGGERQDSDLRVGQRVTLDRIEPCEFSVEEFVAILVGRSGEYVLKCFDIAVLPSVLTDTLTSTPVTEDA